MVSYNCFGKATAFHKTCLSKTCFQNVLATVRPSQILISTQNKQLKHTNLSASRRGACFLGNTWHFGGVTAQTESVSGREQFIQHRSGTFTEEHVKSVPKSTVWDLYPGFQRKTKQSLYKVKLNYIKLNYQIE